MEIARPEYHLKGCYAAKFVHDSTKVGIHWTLTKNEIWGKEALENLLRQEIQSTYRIKDKSTGVGVRIDAGVKKEIKTTISINPQMLPIDGAIFCHAVNDGKLEGTLSDIPIIMGIVSEPELLLRPGTLAFSVRKNDADFLNDAARTGSSSFGTSYASLIKQLQKLTEKYGNVVA